MAFTIKQNDTSPAIMAQLLDGSNDPVNITGATSVRFHMRPVGEGSPAAVIDEDATVVTASTGDVKYVWQAGDTDTNGTYQAEFEVTFATGEIETFPNNGYIEIQVVDDIA